jgi:DNA repair exonuclease SbcCD nuclease subunit|tara:strand:+ start:250 stop:1299 length:1050 start_codon:yes stop_codon:yes gene_type:complete
MKVAIITDTHYGARKGSKLFHDYFEKFYEDIFFPTLEKEGIDTVIHMGDAFDSRKGIEFKALQWAKRVVFDPLKERGIKMHLMVGNHDIYYKNTNSINSVDLLLSEYTNVIPYSSATEVNIDGTDILFIPWITEENEKETHQLIEKTSCSIAMGHLELNGFKAHRGVTMENGYDGKLFEKFTKVFSGHYHTRSDDGRIFYLGNPYEMFWNDVGDRRGFHIFDTETFEHTPVDNPYRLFYQIYYEDNDHQTFDAREYENKLVKVIVKSKTNSTKFEKFIDKLYSVNVSDLKIVENFNFTGWYDGDSSEDLETEDTLSILNRYIEESEVSLDKSVIQGVIREVYQEACELV